MTHDFPQDGFTIHRRMFSPEQCDALISALAEASSGRTAKSPNRRHLLRDVPAVAVLAASRALMELARRYSQAPVFAVRGLLFDKAAGANWSVTWHQDVTISVRTRIETPGYTGWSVKDGVVHVHPPAAVLEQMVSIRVHLDACGEDNGALEILPGSHRGGILDAEAIAQQRRDRKPIQCPVQRGDAIVMRPLLLHSSPRSITPTHRRVIHLEYGSCELPNGLEWFDRVP